MNFSLFLNTVIYLKPAQIYYRLLRRFVKPKARQFKICRAKTNDGWVYQELYTQKLLDKKKVSFLNKNGSVLGKACWNTSTQEKLWLYNLHYFDDLISFGSSERRDLQSYWIKKWIKENPPGVGNGWEPYPTSLRIVNWIKFYLSESHIPDFVSNSLGQQTDYLSQDLEFHLMGNHLFVNAKALIFAGLFFDGGLADKWLNTGLKLLNREIKEQVLDDGGNFELSPMYHNIMLVDLIDLINIFNVFKNKVDAKQSRYIRGVVKKMLAWLKHMSHNDGSISFFNDAAFGIAPENDIILNYARKLDLVEPQDSEVRLNNIELIDLTDSGYISVKSMDFSLIADLAEVGPTYIPGHAHADTLSFEFCLGEERIFVNSGISEYGTSKERLRQRKTGAHNTVVIDDKDSTQVWSGFRVAKRANVLEREVFSTNDQHAKTFRAKHDGFNKQGINCYHMREWVVSETSLIFYDHLVGRYNSAIANLHLHPNVMVDQLNVDCVRMSTAKYNLHLKVTGGVISLAKTTWHPNFGISLESSKLCFKFTSSKMKVAITWKNK